MSSPISRPLHRLFPHLEDFYPLSKFSPLDPALWAPAQPRSHCSSCDHQKTETPKDQGQIYGNFVAQRQWVLNSKFLLKANEGMCEGRNTSPLPPDFDVPGAMLAEDQKRRVLSPGIWSLRGGRCKTSSYIITSCRP